MKVLLHDGRKATVIGDLTDKLVKIKLEDGREMPYPKDKIKPAEETESEEEFKIVKIPAIERLEELRNDCDRLLKMQSWWQDIPEGSFYNEFATQLLDEARQEIKTKWGLT